MFFKLMCCLQLLLRKDVAVAIICYFICARARGRFTSNMFVLLLFPNLALQVPESIL